MRDTKGKLISIGLLLTLGVSSGATAGLIATVPEDYPARLRASSNVQSLSTESVFGDKIGLYTGSLEFLQTDLVLPGNGELDIVVSRKLTAGAQGGNKLFSNWDLAIPSVHGIFSDDGGWNSGLGGRNLNRCSSYAWPYDESVIGEAATRPVRTILSHDFWHGTFLFLPGVGDEEVLKTTPDSRPRPTNGLTYPLTTKSGAMIRCIASNNDQGEGFEVLTPSGVTYQLAFMAKRGQQAILKYGESPGSVTPGRWVLRRSEYFLFPTSAKDRFGNQLTYHWNNSTGLLTKITANDGRSVEFFYTGSSISQIRSSGREWNYDYSTGVLTSVTLPDKSYWAFTPGLTMATEGAGNIPANITGGCNRPGTPTYSTTGSMQHPSGAIASFTLTPTLHGRSYEQYNCTMPTRPASDLAEERTPARFYAFSLTKKVMRGPGLPAPLTWVYSYGAPNACYGSGLASTDAFACRPESPTEKSVEVIDPSGITTRYAFSNRADHTDGQLLRIEKPGRLEINTYDAGTSGQYSPYAGVSIMPSSGRGWYLSRISPLAERSIIQDGMKFSWKVNSFDHMARPTNITESSNTVP